MYEPVGPQVLVDTLTYVHPLLVGLSLVAQVARRLHRTQALSPRHFAEPRYLALAVALFAFVGRGHALDLAPLVALVLLAVWVVIAVLLRGGVRG